jgi:hypothetical protein
LRILWRLAKTQSAIVEAAPLTLDAAAFEDALKIAWWMLMETQVPIRTIARGLQAVAKASGREVELLSWVTDRDVDGLPRKRQELKVRALVAEVEGRVLVAGEIPGRSADPFTVEAIEAVRRDDPEFDDSRGEFSLRTLHESAASTSFRCCV